MKPKWPCEAKIGDKIGTSEREPWAEWDGGSSNTGRQMWRNLQGRKIEQASNLTTCTK